ncbi:hypothetical protein FJT64_008950 [Amphibalanus amphitrite]|uniref:Uncharacterized protein n=1 Tax=Amphibalanus amphitrite TaxID=1232801 RepID=A0A6A4VT29_AMPAM|nr:hypothetical protein FJT64_008950 [Amphibalanus amphitrite]
MQLIHSRSIAFVFLVILVGAADFVVSQERGYVHTSHVCQAADCCIFLLRSADQQCRPISSAVAQLRRLCDNADGLPPQYQEQT